MNIVILVIAIPIFLTLPALAKELKPTQDYQLMSETLALAENISLPERAPTSTLALRIFARKAVNCLRSCDIRYIVAAYEFDERPDVKIYDLGTMKEVRNFAWQKDGVLILTFSDKTSQTLVWDGKDLKLN